MRLQLLGPALLSPDGAGGATALPFERRSQVLAWLALRTHWSPRSELAAMLWPEQPDRLAFTNLRKTLFRMQQPPWTGLVASQGASLRAEVGTDVRDFEGAVRAGRHADAVALYRGALLTGFDDPANDAWTSWLRHERERLRTAWRGAVASLLDAAAPPAGALDLSACLLEDDPLDEVALRRHLTLLVAAGQAGRARAAHREFVRRLRDELGLEPGPALAAWEPEPAPSPFAALASPATPAREGFIGRASERQRIASLLGRPEVRLLTLTGPGGIGKTRLAGQVAADLASGPTGDVVLVRLESATDRADFVNLVAQALSCVFRGRSDPLQQLCAAVAPRRLLLVLDNVEQLAAHAAGVIGPLLEAAPGLRILATSRMRLGLAQEHLLPVEGLPCPEPEDVDRIEAFDASRLFIEAARHVAPALAPARDAAAIADICRLLDGLPLALQLAAAWTRVLSCAAIAAELRQGTALLRSSDTTIDSRHASIEQVFEQSWRQLSAAERDALAALSVFETDFDAEAARAVAGAPVAVLASLSDKSLLRGVGHRLSLHPLVRQLAAVRLDPDRSAQARQQHAAFHSHRLTLLGGRLNKGERDALLAFEAGFADWCLAWQWQLSHGQAAPVRSMFEALKNFLDHRGRSTEARELVRQAMDTPALHGSAGLQDWLLVESAHIEYRLDEYLQAEALARRGLTGALARRDRPVAARAHDVLGTCALRLGHNAAARRHFARALALHRVVGDSGNMAAGLDHLALAEKRLGRFDAALTLSLESLSEHRRLGDSAGVALCLSNLASLYMERREPDAALPLLREARETCERDGLAGILPYVLANLCELALQQDRLADARAHAGHAIEASLATGNRAVLTWAGLMDARAALRQGDVDAARKVLAEHAAASAELRVPVLQALALQVCAEQWHAQGDRRAPDRLLDFGMRHPSMADTVRSALQDERLRLGLPARGSLPWNGPDDLDTLLRRVAAEAPAGHAALRALLGA